jgi:hypothetical protein
MLEQAFDRVTAPFRRCWWLSYLVGYLVVMTIPFHMIMRAALYQRKLELEVSLSHWLQQLLIFGAFESIPWGVLTLREAVSKSRPGMMLIVLFTVASVCAYFSLRSPQYASDGATFLLVVIGQIGLALFIVLVAWIYRVTVKN